MAIAYSQIGNLGFDEETAKKIAQEADSPETKIMYLRNARKALDEGKLNAGDFSKIFQPLADRINSDTNWLSSQGSDKAGRVNNLWAALAQDTGFERDGSDRTKVNLKLPEKYQQDVRDKKIPENLTPEEKDQIKQIPTDVEYGTDRFKIEQEGIRENAQNNKAADEAKLRRQQSLTDLGGILAKRNTDDFNNAIPDIAEQANVKGIYRSTGFGDALARERGRLQSNTDSALAMQGLSDREINETDIANALGKKQGFQFDALSRDFSNKDYATQIRDAMTIANLSAPKQSSGKSGAGILQGALGGASTGASVGGPWGALIGAGAGAGAGYFATK